MKATQKIHRKRILFLEAGCGRKFSGARDSVVFMPVQMSAADIERIIASDCGA